MSRTGIYFRNLGRKSEAHRWNRMSIDSHDSEESLYRNYTASSYPTRNRFFCNAIGRSKMLFKSEKEALMFIAYNKDQFASSKYVPCRAYKCCCCDGWHLTHLEEVPEERVKREEQILAHSTRQVKPRALKPISNVSNVLPAVSQPAPSTPSHKLTAEEKAELTAQAMVTFPQRFAEVLAGLPALQIVLLNGSDKDACREISKMTKAIYDISPYTRKLDCVKTAVSTLLGQYAKIADRYAEPYYVRTFPDLSSEEEAYEKFLEILELHPKGCGGGSLSSYKHIARDWRDSIIAKKLKIAA